MNTEVGAQHAVPVKQWRTGTYATHIDDRIRIEMGNADRSRSLIFSELAFQFPVARLSGPMAGNPRTILMTAAILSRKPRGMLYRCR